MKSNRYATTTEIDSRLNAYSKAALAAVAVGALGSTDAAAQTAVSLISAVSSTPTGTESVFSFQFATNEVGLIAKGGIFSGQPMNIYGNDVELGGAVQSNHWWVSSISAPSARELVAVAKSARIDAGNADLFFGRSFKVAGLKASPSPGGWVQGPWGGQFLNATGYVAFHANGYFGWLRAHGTLVGDTFTLEFLPLEGTNIYGAYAQGGILAGQTASAVPEPATVATSLGLLALGAAGVRELRRRRKSEAAA